MKSKTKGVYPTHFQDKDGISVRDYTAIQIVGHLASVPNTGITKEGLCKKAIELTDELLKQLGYE